MKGYPVTVRLLDPPLHEFLPTDAEKIKTLTLKLGIPLSEVQLQIQSLKESNPMLGHRGVRLGISYPEITKMQVQAIFEAAAEMILQRKKIFPEIMIPVTINERELQHQKIIVREIHDQVCEKYQLKKIPYHFGTMIETPRAALCADAMAKESEFFSFGTNDLTQMTMGLSRDDIGSFLPDYLKKNILSSDPFAHIEKEGIGQLIKMAIQKGRKINRLLEVGVCGEHAGDPESITFFSQCGLNYVSCSPFRVPVARLASAQSSILNNIKVN
jgi:pyruvate,orthophosphate dikinase